MAEINQGLEERAQAALERAKASNLADMDSSPLADRVPAPDRDWTGEQQTLNFNDQRIHPNTVPPEQRAVRVDPSPDMEEVPPPPSEEEMAAYLAHQNPAPAPAADPEETIISGSTQQTSLANLEDEETVIFASEVTDKLQNMPPQEQKSFLSALLPEVESYRKDLIINGGLTPAEAQQAANNRAKNKAEEANTKWVSEHPDGAIVVIDKSQEEQVEFNEEDKRKMQLSRAMKLVIVENAELETIRVKPHATPLSMSNLRDICGSLSHYSVPLLETGDYATFIGAQSGALTNATTSDDDDFVDIIEKKASLLYQFFQQATLQSRTVEDKDPNTGRPTTRDMTYEEFCNWYKYDDIDMGVFAVVTASAMETSESTYQCQNDQCRRVYSISYNNKSLLDLSGIPEEHKKRVEEIDQARSSKEKMAELRERYRRNTRFKSPFSKNIFEMGSPTIAGARHRLDVCSTKINGSNVLDMLMLIYIDQLWLYDNRDDSYHLVRVDDDPSIAFDAICSLHEVDMQLISRWISENKYHAQFKIKTSCPFCKREATDLLSADGMIFLHARATFTEIQ